MKVVPLTITEGEDQEEDAVGDVQEGNQELIRVGVINADNPSRVGLASVLTVYKIENLSSDS
jgi:hypothetical protein